MTRKTITHVTAFAVGYALAVLRPDPTQPRPEETPHSNRATETTDPKVAAPPSRPIWNATPQAASTSDFWKTPNGKCFHRKDCRYLSPKYHPSPATQRDIASRNLKPCGHCK